MRRARNLAIAAVVSAGMIATASAAASERVVAVKGVDGPGPSKYDKTYVTKFGPASAQNVLVLMPGYEGGAGDFTLTGRYLTSRIPNLQVWAIDRRSQALEDVGTFRKALSGNVTLQQMFDHYLGWITNGGTPADHFNFLDQSTVGFAKKWGLPLALGDERKVVLAARDGGRRNVILGGHSLGASMTTAYAAWDFNGHPGYKDVDGLVLIDGGLLGSFDAYDLDQAKQALTSLEASSTPFVQLLGPALPPESAGLFAEVGGIYARRAASGSASTLQAFPLLPPQFNPSFGVTNRALLGNAFDRDTSPASLALLHVNAGGLAASGTPRDWVDGGVTPISRLAQTFGQEPSNAVEWYFPQRLTIDVNGADQLKQNAAARFLGLRLKHLKQVNVPVYAIQTDLTNGGVLRGAKRFIQESKTTFKESTLVNADPQESHLDPLTAAPDRNAFFRSVVPFLKTNFR
jgi:pimeloyl-ACP methyl ester carboxylesterase